MEVLKISIKNWDKYNPRKDLKSLTWIRLDGDIGFSESLFGLSVDAKWLWIFLLSYSTKKNNGEFEIDKTYLAHHSGIEINELDEILDNLENKKLIDVKLASSRIRSDTIENVPYERTNDTNITNDTNEHACEETGEIPKDILITIKFNYQLPDQTIEDIRKDAWLAYQGSTKFDKNWRRFIANYFANNQEKIRKKLIESAKPSKKENMAVVDELISRVINNSHMQAHEFQRLFEDTELELIRSVGGSRRISSASPFDLKQIKNELALKDLGVI